MSEKPARTSLSVHHDAWIRREIQALVMNLPAPLLTADLLQSALVAAVQAMVVTPLTDPDGHVLSDAEVAAVLQQRVRSALLDQVRQMGLLSRPQRRQWTLVRLAREILQTAGPPVRTPVPLPLPAPEAVAALCGLSVQEIQALERLAGIGPAKPDEATHELLRMQAEGPPSEAERLMARVETQAILDQIAPIFVRCPDLLRGVASRALGISCAPSRLRTEELTSESFWQRMRRLLSSESSHAVDQRRVSDRLKAPSRNTPRATPATATATRSFPARPDGWPHQIEALLASALPRA